MIIENESMIEGAAINGGILGNWNCILCGSCTKGSLHLIRLVCLFYFIFVFHFLLWILFISIFCVPEVHKGSLRAFLKKNIVFCIFVFLLWFYCWNKLQLLFLPWLCPVLQCSIDTRMWLSARLVYLPSGRGLTRTNRDPPIMIHYLSFAFHWISIFISVFVFY